MIMVVDQRQEKRREGKRREEEEEIETECNDSLEEVVESRARRDDSLTIRDSVEDLKVPREVGIEGQDRSDVAASVAVVGRRPHGHQVLLGEHELVALLHQLMRSANQLQLVDTHKLVGGVGTKQPASTTRANLPALDILGIRPHQVAESTLVGDLLVAVDGSDLIEGLDIRRKTAVDAKNLTIDQSSKGQVVKDLSAVLPGIGAGVLLLALIVEAVDLSDLARLVVAAQQRNLLRIPRLEYQEQGKGLQAVVSSVNKVTHEDVVCVGQLTSCAEELKEVIELTVDITTDGDRAVDRLHVRLLEQELLDLFAELLEVRLAQRLALTHGLEPLVKFGSHFAASLE